MSIIHTVGVLDVFVHFEPPFMTEQKVDHPPQEDGEFMTKCSVGKLMTEKCTRGNEMHHTCTTGGIKSYMYMYTYKPTGN